MTLLLGPHIPVLYCMLYYRSARRYNTTTSYHHHPHRVTLDLPVDTSTKQGDQSEETGHSARQNGPDRPWIHHNRKTDLNKICSGHHPMGPNANGPRETDDHFGQRSPEDIRSVLPGRFMSEGELQAVIAHVETAGSTKEASGKINYVARVAARPKTSEPLTTGSCQSCQTEMGYEVWSEVRDITGANFTVVNFNSGYQFIATGRCVNENSPCGGVDLQARCRQIYRAHWTLVWTSEMGATQLVAHEVPSHCQCLSVGATRYPVHQVQVGEWLDVITRP